MTNRLFLLPKLLFIFILVLSSSCIGGGGGSSGGGSSSGGRNNLPPFTGEEEGGEFMGINLTNPTYVDLSAYGSIQGSLSRNDLGDYYLVTMPAGEGDRVLDLRLTSSTICPTVPLSILVLEDTRDGYLQSLGMSVVREGTCRSAVALVRSGGTYLIGITYLSSNVPSQEVKYTLSVNVTDPSFPQGVSEFSQEPNDKFSNAISLGTITQDRTRFLLLGSLLPKFNIEKILSLSTGEYFSGPSFQLDEDRFRFTISSSFLAPMVYANFVSIPGNPLFGFPCEDRGEDLPYGIKIYNLLVSQSERLERRRCNNSLSYFPQAQDYVLGIDSEFSVTAFYYALELTAYSLATTTGTNWAVDPNNTWETANDFDAIQVGGKVQGVIRADLEELFGWGHADDYFRFNVTYTTGFKVTLQFFDGPLGTKCLDGISVWEAYILSPSGVWLDAFGNENCESRTLTTNLFGNRGSGRYGLVLLCPDHWRICDYTFSLRVEPLP
jgi:hypothetical protein